MHTVELLEQCLELAAHLGYELRQEWLGGSGGGACEIAGQKTLFLDLALSPVEQLDLVIEALRSDPGIMSMVLDSQMRHLLNLRKTA